MPPSYADKNFWDTRFEAEISFEWLGEGDIIVDAVRKTIMQQNENHSLGETRFIPKILHIGAGTSDLDTKLLSITVCGERDSLLVNTDFSPQAMKKAIQRSHLGNNDWRVSDALSWKDISELHQVYGQFNIVVDKSTSDAISCGEDIIIANQAGTDTKPTHPLYMQLLQSNREIPIAIPPLEMLALHLASVVNPGGTWIVLSYSSNRFPFLGEDEASSYETSRVPVMGQWWRVDHVVPIEAPSGQSNENVYAPAIMHYLYVLKRTSMSPLT
jgi:hypothetical protein